MSYATMLAQFRNREQHVIRLCADRVVGLFGGAHTKNPDPFPDQGYLL
jgi:hypothetical protein